MPKEINKMKQLLKLVPVLFMFLTGCATIEPYNYAAYEAELPRSILVIPPINSSIDVKASYTYLSTVTMPLAEKGYYVFPVSVIDNLLKENGLPTPTEMNSIPLDKIQEHIGADAVLYVTIEKWGQEYQVISSVTTVKGYAKLVSVKSGNLLWEAPLDAQISSDSAGLGLIGALVNAAITQVVGDINDRTPAVSSIANMRAFNATKRGLLNGPYKKTANK